MKSVRREWIAEEDIYSISAGSIILNKSTPIMQQGKNEKLVQRGKKLAN